MSTHTVALDGEAFAVLKAQKRAGESFSMVVKRLARPWKPLTDVAGGWKDMSAAERKEMDRIYRDISKANRRRDERILAKWG